LYHIARFYGIITYMKKNKNYQGPDPLYFEEEGVAFFMWEDDPFVVTVTASKTPRGYLTDWWISGLTHEGFHNKEENGYPTLLLRAQIGVSKKESKAVLQADLLDLWETHFLDIAFDSAIQGGIPAKDSKTDAETKKLHAQHHLEGHDHLGHFDSSISVSPLTERSARQYSLLTSLGYPKAQKLIADYESKTHAIEVSVGAIDRRLYISRRAGLIQKKQTETKFFKNTNDWR
jgi:hypothetical protein